MTSKIKICFHKYKQFADGDEYKICIKCGKLRPPRWIRWTLFKLDFSDFIFKIRRIQYCPHHGYSHQNWFTGYCKTCKRNKWTKKEIQKSEREMESYY